MPKLDARAAGQHHEEFAHAQVNSCSNQLGKSGEISGVKPAAMMSKDVLKTV